MSPDNRVNTINLVDSRRRVGDARCICRGQLHSTIVGLQSPAATLAQWSEPVLPFTPQRPRSELVELERLLRPIAQLHARVAERMHLEAATEEIGKFLGAELPEPQIE